MYEYGLIGNCQTTALIHRSGSLSWLCWPRPDSPPLFGKLIDEQGGEFSIRAIAEQKSHQHYLPNTNILITDITTRDGVFRITDFCPRFEQFGRIFRPNSVLRIVEPIKGNPHIQVSIDPVSGWSKEKIAPNTGSNHLQFSTDQGYLRLLTTMSLTHLIERQEFVLTEKLYFALTWNHTIDENLAHLAEDFLGRTDRYWQTWVKHCAIPSDFQRETIRSALALKLHCFEDTGAILAASTTSLPEEKGGVRNWDYRFSWLRDSYFVLSAFHMLGHFEEMEGFLKFLLNVAYREENLRPLYAIDGSIPLPEHLYDNWDGYAQSKPVRSNNEAATHIQNDVYGEMLLAFAPIFLDERFHHLRTRDHEALVAHLARKCFQSLAVPDAGLWELRGNWRVHSFTDLLCWAGLHQAQRLCRLGFLRELTFDIDDWVRKAEATVRQSVVDGALRNGPTDPSFNAALLQMAILRFPDRALIEKTITETAKGLGISDGSEPSPFLYRYRFIDDFGKPKSAFVCCSFWWAQALGVIGKKEEGKKILFRTLECANRLGLFSEHFELHTKEQLGNFPQAYSHVGLINSAFAVSTPWSEII